VASQWLDGAIRLLGESSGRAVAGAGPKIGHHTTEGASSSGAVGAYRASRSWPTLTAEWTGVRLRFFQHMPLDMMARAFEHPPGTPETNRANVTQIEHVGFTDDSARARAGADPSLHVSRWPTARWHAIAALCREIEAVTGCPRRSAVPFSWWDAPQRLSGTQFVVVPGHLGHVHAANNHHTDGTGFKIELVLGGAGGGAGDKPSRRLRPGMAGADVLALQLAVRLRASRCGRTDRMPTADGVYGAETMRDAAFVGYVLGIGDSQGALVDDGLSAGVQGLIRDPSGRNATQKRRAAARRAKHCHKGE
jgi:hypothetical protein